MVHIISELMHIKSYNALFLHVLNGSTHTVMLTHVVNMPLMTVKLSPAFRHHVVRHIIALFLHFSIQSCISGIFDQKYSSAESNYSTLIKYVNGVTEIVSEDRE